MCERALCHGGETNCFSSTCLDVCTECPPSAASKLHSKTCHWRCDQGIRIPCGQCLGCRKKKRSRLTWHCSELDTLFLAAVNLATLLRRLLLSLRVITMFNQRLWYWRWSCRLLWLVVWVPCRQKCEGLSVHRSAVLAQISQKCVSCSNCPPKCVERSSMTVQLSHKHCG